MERLFRLIGEVVLGGFRVRLLGGIVSLCWEDCGQ